MGLFWVLLNLNGYDGLIKQIPSNLFFNSVFLLNLDRINLSKLIQMKKHYQSIFFLLLIFSTINAEAQTSMVQGKLEYMLKESSDRVFEIAKKENKPVLVYVNSQSCFTSKKFSREVMNQPKVKSLLHKKFICMNADISTGFGKQIANKYGVLMTPALFLFSPDKEISFHSKLEMDTAVMLSQFRGFLTAFNLLTQVKMQLKTTKKSEKEIIKEIGRSYASTDFKKDHSVDPSQKITAKTLNIDYFKEFEEGYLEEWRLLQEADKKKQLNEK